MSDLDKLLFNIEKKSELVEMCKNGIRELIVMRNLLTFAIANRDKFTEHDPDGVKAHWIEGVEKWSKMP